MLGPSDYRPGQDGRRAVQRPDEVGDLVLGQRGRPAPLPMISEVPQALAPRGRHRASAGRGWRTSLLRVSQVYSDAITARPRMRGGVGGRPGKLELYGSFSDLLGGDIQLAAQIADQGGFGDRQAGGVAGPL